jgi:hypothetical protein
MIFSVLLLVGTLFISGIVGSIWARRLTEGPKKRNMQFVSICLCGIAVCILGLYEFVGIRLSGHSLGTGVLTNPVQYNHGKSHGTFLHVHTADGRSLYVWCDYLGDHLVAGESVSVDALDFNMQVLHLTVLDGRYAGWTLDERDGSISAYIILALGLAFVVGAWLDWRRNPNGIDEPVTLPKD